MAPPAPARRSESGSGARQGLFVQFKKQRTEGASREVPPAPARYSESERGPPSSPGPGGIRAGTAPATTGAPHLSVPRGALPQLLQGHAFPTMQHSPSPLTWSCWNSCRHSASALHPSQASHNRTTSVRQLARTVPPHLVLMKLVQAQRIWQHARPARARCRQPLPRLRSHRDAASADLPAAGAAHAGPQGAAH